MSKIDGKKALRDIFQEAGFKIIDVVKEDFFMLVPPAEEGETHGIPCISRRAMSALETALASYVSER